MHPSQQALLDRILTSPQFANTLTLGRILRYMCENTVGTERRLKEYEIATEVLQRHHSFDPKLDPVIRVSMKGIRERLQAYFDNAGKLEPIRLVIPMGQYHVEFIEGHPPPGADIKDGAQVLKYFWSPYFAQERANVIVHTEPLFFREGWDMYVRNLYVNDPEKGTCEIKERLPELRARDLNP